MKHLGLMSLAAGGHMCKCDSCAEMKDPSERCQCCAYMLLGKRAQEVHINPTLTSHSRDRDRDRPMLPEFTSNNMLFRLRAPLFNIETRNLNKEIGNIENDAVDHDDDLKSLLDYSDTYGQGFDSDLMQAVYNAMYGQEDGTTASNQFRRTGGIQRWKRRK